MNGRRWIELPADATWHELRRAAEVLADEGGSTFPLALIEAVARVEREPGHELDADRRLAPASA